MLSIDHMLKAGRNGWLRTVAAIACGLLPTMAHAAVFDGGGLWEGLSIAAGIESIAHGTLEETVIGTIDRIVFYMGLLATIVIVISGLYLILGMGEEDRKNKCKNTIFYTIIGMAVVLLARSIVAFVFFLLGAGGQDAAPIVTDILGRVLAYTGLIATIVIVVAGFYLILGLGDEASKDKAKKIIQYTIVGLILIALAATIVAFVYSLVTGSPDPGVRQILTDIVKRVLEFLALIATITIVVAGFYLVLSFGSEDGKEKAKKIIIYTIAGLIVILLARIIVGLVTNFLA